MSSPTLNDECIVFRVGIVFICGYEHSSNFYSKFMVEGFMSDVLTRLGLEEVNGGAWAGGPIAIANSDSEVVECVNPSTGKVLGKVQLAGLAEYEKVVSKAEEVFVQWRMVPAPKRGEIVRQMGEALREHKDDLGALVSMEVGKVLSEGLGEVQESIDMADFCVGLSRQLYGLSMHSERPLHRMYEQWHPLGPVGVITAFNFPNAVWAWNAMVALVCGNTVVWKPSLKASMTALATHKLMNDVLAKHGFEGALGLIIGSDAEVGETMIADKRLPLISATGSGFGPSRRGIWCSRNSRPKVYKYT